MTQPWADHPGPPREAAGRRVSIRFHCHTERDEYHFDDDESGVASEQLVGARNRAGILARLVYIQRPAGGERLPAILPRPLTLTLSLPQTTYAI